MNWNLKSCALWMGTTLLSTLSIGAEAESTGALETATLPALTVSAATGLDMELFSQPYAIYRHDRDELNNGVGQTALDRIDYGPGMIIQHTSPAQTTPYIRGLTGKQNLLLLDGVRLSHATMRGGPNQYAALIPDMSIQSIDVILGPSSVVNGSDGLTGALDFRLATAGRGVGKPASPWVTARMDSANGIQSAAGVDGQSGNWRYSFEGSMYDFHDRTGGNDSADNVFGDNKEAYDGIPNTAFEQTAFAGRMAYDGFEDHIVEMKFGQTSQNDARRPDGYYENSGKDSRISRYYDPETFSYVHLRDIWMPSDAFFDQLTTTAWWHQQDEAQYREELTGGGSVYRRREYDDRIDSTGVESQAMSQLDNHQLTYGVFILFERTSNDYSEYRNLDGSDATGATAYQAEEWGNNTTITDGAEYNTYATYVQDYWQLSEEWSLLMGLRYTYVDWNFDTADSHTDDLTGGVRAAYQFREDMMTFFGLSKAFRAPNLNDLDGATDRASSGTTAFGNPELEPEVSYTAEAGWRYAEGRNELALSVFYTQIEDVIQTVYPEGGGAGSTQNGESAYLQGFEVFWDYGIPVLNKVGNRLALVGSVSLVDSEAKVPQSDGSILEEPISRANRVYGTVGLRYEIDRNWWTQLQTRFHDAYDEDDLASGDSGDVRLTIPGNGDGTVPGFAVVDLSGGWMNDEGSRWLTMTLENLADKTYRQLGSGMDASGFNVVLSGGLRF
ncbi:TonB-dependent receptor [Kiritimatiellota bacterium B12222]|nr:TonB-dependent receptor [Kiritimatiellota bacterium B12222]